MSGNVFAAIFGILAAVLIVSLLRNRYLREKYAATWILIAAGVLVLSLFPGILDAMASWFGVITPVNIVFFIGALALLIISVQFSIELSRTEERVRRLAEEVAILRSVMEGISESTAIPSSDVRADEAGTTGESS